MRHQRGATTRDRARESRGKGENDRSRGERKRQADGEIKHEGGENLTTGAGEKGERSE